MEAFFVESRQLYTKQVIDNMILQRLQKYSTEKLAKTDTEDTHMDIELETTADRRQLQYIIKKQILEDTTNICQGLHLLKDSINSMK